MIAFCRLSTNWSAPPSATLVSGARVAKLADAKDLKSFSRQRECGFDSRPGHQAVYRTASIQLECTQQPPEGQVVPADVCRRRVPQGRFPDQESGRSPLCFEDVS